MQTLLEVNIDWKETNEYNVIKGYAGKWQLFSIFYNSIDKTKDNYVLTTKLFGIKQRLFFPSIEVAKEKAEGILNYWLSQLRYKIMNYYNELTIVFEDKVISALKEEFKDANNSYYISASDNIIEHMNVLSDDTITKLIGLWMLKVHPDAFKGDIDLVYSKAEMLIDFLQKNLNEVLKTICSRVTS